MTMHIDISARTTASRLLMLLVVGSCIALISACVSPPPSPEDTESAAIGIVMEKQWDEDGRKERVHRIYFIRWNDSDDPTKQNEIIESNYHRDGRVYLLNAKPGRYSAVAATDFIGGAFVKTGRSRQVARRGVPPARPAFVSFTSTPPFSGATGASPLFAMGGSDLDGGDNMDEYSAFTAYLSEDLVKKTSVEVRAGEFAIMGQFQVLMKWGIRSGDRAQVHFFHAIGPKMSDPKGMPIFDIENNQATRARMVKESRGNETSRKLLGLALGDFSGTPWEAKVRRQVERLR